MYQVYKILDGDTLESISNRLSITPDEIVRLNGISYDDFSSGDLIVLPKNNDLYFTYTVRTGDTLYDISQKYGKDLNVLYKINGIKDGEYIYPNQEILIPNDDIFVYVTGDEDTLYDIANSFNVDVTDLVKYNENLRLLSDQVVIYKRD